MKTQRVTLPIYGLSCGGGGALTVERALAKVPGVVQVYVNPATEMAYVEYNPTLSGPEQLMAAVERAGFQAGEPSAR
ncbi:MAG: heavy-metal-associated domain-containing protein [Deinococcus sp.]|nr:heavy-metal-associated domain-containing protein [Deinococcus sp.]